MKRLILTTTVTLPDEDEHFLYKYVHQNGFTKSQVDQLKNAGHFTFEADEKKITLRQSARVYDPDQETSL